MPNGYCSKWQKLNLKRLTYCHSIISHLRVVIPVLLLQVVVEKKQSAAAMLDESIKVPSARPPDCLYCFITSILRQSNQKYDYSASMHSLSLYGYIYNIHIYICICSYVITVFILIFLLWKEATAAMTTLVYFYT